MTTVLMINGSSSRSSRTLRVLDYLQQQFDQLDIPVTRVHPYQFNPASLISHDFSDPDIQHYQQQVDKAQLVIITTPIYQASFSGVLKLLLDLIPHKGLTGKALLPIATAGSARHMLAMDFALKPVLSALGASHLLPSVFVTDDSFIRTNDRIELSQPLKERLNAVLEDVFTPLPVLQRGRAFISPTPIGVQTH